jgi:DNA repair protein RecN (Recombination protein N)
MIQELRIENFAIIDQLELKLTSGLVILTGETGAGKSIIIDAVEALLGSRADTSVVRLGEERAIIEATFAIPASIRHSVHEILIGEELLDDPDSVTLGREIRSKGGSVGRINGRTANIGLMRQLGELLVDVHGQSEHLSLLRVNHHLDLLDRFADIEPLKWDYHQVYSKLLEIRKELASLRKSESEAARQIDILNFQINEIENAHLHLDDEATLTEERNRLANAEGLSKRAQEILQLLDEGTPDSPAATDLVGQTLKPAAGLARLDHSQETTENRIQEIFEQLQDLSAELHDYLENIEFNPKRLDRVEERLLLIQNLKRKYGNRAAATIEDVLAFADRARETLDAITHAEERIETLEGEEEQLLGKIAQSGEALSQKRRQTAEMLAQEMENELETLQMEQARFKVDFKTQPDPDGVLLSDGQRVAFDSTGLEKIEFLVAPNPGEGLKPLVKIASGGETSRLMLAIKNVLARADRIPTLIFDEIDQGIGGRVGTIVGSKLRKLSHNHQVLCVTHLPQLAAFGDQHFQVQKAIVQGRTTTKVEPLEQEARVNELAMMMGTISDGTRQSARELLQSVTEITPD